jgi:Protein of unknown function (DUF559)
VSERLASTYRRTEFTEPHLAAIEALSRENVLYMAEVVVRTPFFDSKNRAVSYKPDVLNQDPRYPGLIIFVDGEAHGSAKQQGRDLVQDTRLRSMGFRVLRVRNADAPRILELMEPYKKEVLEFP